VRVSGNLATVRWGPGLVQAPPPKRPAGAEGAEDAPAQLGMVEVVGVEYDEPGLGKHDGTHQGERLFSCPPGHGSFVKLDKIEFGVPIQRALASKYFAGMLAEAASKGQRAEEVDAVDFVDSKGREKSMSVELVGRYSIEQRQQRLEGFVELALAETCFATRYPDDTWEGDWSLPNLKSLWLDKSLVNEWSDVVAVCELCPRLDWLSLARTRLRPISRGSSLPLPAEMPEAMSNRLVLQPFVCKVKTLVLNWTNVSWEELLALDELNVFPFLENLHIAHNGLSEGVPPGLVAEGKRRPFPNLRSLVLDGNGISDWRVLQRAIETFPKLEQLHMNANLLGESLEGLAEVAADDTPRRLTALSLNENKLSTWPAVGALCSYAVLELRAQKNPLTEGESPLASPMLLRQIIIALMPTLMRLNASEVSSKERTAAERYILGLASKGGCAFLQALAEGCDVAAHVERLRGVHGEIVGGDLTEEAQAQRSALAQSLVQVSLRPIGGAILDQKPVSKRLPHTMTVAELKRVCQAFFKQVPYDRIQLQLADPALPFGVPLDDEARELGFYGVGDGAEIRVDDAQDLERANAKH